MTSLKERVALAIWNADVKFGYSISLIRLVDGVSTYRLTYPGEPEQIEFSSHADALEYADKRHADIRADAAIAECTRWQPITGPIYNYVWIACPSVEAPGHYRRWVAYCREDANDPSGESWWGPDVEKICAFADATHWMPLPALPPGEKIGGAG